MTSHDEDKEQLAQVALKAHFGQTLAEIKTTDQVTFPDQRRSLSSAQYARVKELFQRVMSLPRAERAEIISSETADDPFIRDEVLNLLQHHESPSLNKSSKGELTAILQAKRGWSSTWTRAGRERAKRLMLGLAAALFVALLVSGALFAERQLSIILKNGVGDQLQTINAMEVHAIHSWVQARLQAVDLLSRDQGIQKSALELLDRARDPGSDPTQFVGSTSDIFIQDSLGKLKAKWGFSTIGLLDPTMLVVTSNIKPVIGARITSLSPDNSYIVKAMRGETPIFGGPRQLGINMTKQAPDHRQIVFFGATIFDAKSRARGVIALGEYLETNLYQILKSARMGTSAESYLVNINGVMVTQSRFGKEIQKAWSNLGYSNFDATVGIPLRDPGGNILEGYQPQDAQEALPFTKAASQLLAAGKGGSGSAVSGVLVRPYLDYRGIPVVGAWNWFPEYGFGIITEVDADQAFKPLHLLQLLMGAVGGTILIVALGWVTVSIALYRTRKKYRTERIGAYHLVQKIAEGGVGIVYLARHDQLRRPTAIKVLKETRPSPSVLERFEEEAKQVCRLNHPNTVQIYDFGISEAGQMFIAMEYLRGINLSELLAIEGSLSSERAVHIIRQVAASLSEAHSLGLIHRDIKPLNVMLCQVGGCFDHIKVLDFGLVKQWNDFAQNNGDGATRNIQGTPLYMAPERLRRNATVDNRSDIYSVGVLLFVLLSGRSPFNGDNDLTTIQEILQGRVLPLKNSKNPLHPGLVALTLRCLSAVPEARPHSATQLLQELNCLDIAVWTPAQATAWWEARPSLLKSANLSDLPSDKA